MTPSAPRTPVVLVPGLGLGPEAYLPTLRHLSTRCTVLDLPGHGRPAARTEDLRTEAQAERLLNAVTRRSVLVGHSASSQIVAEAALRRPDLVAGLVMIAPCGDLDASSWPTLVSRLLASAVWESPRLVPSLARQYRRTTPASMIRTMEAARHYDLAATVRRLTVPAVFVRGLRDHIAPEQWTQRLAGLTGAAARGRPGGQVDEAAELRDASEAWTLSTGAHLPALTNGRELAAIVRRLTGPEPEAAQALSWTSLTRQRPSHAGARTGARAERATSRRS